MTSLFRVTQTVIPCPLTASSPIVALLLRMCSPDFSLDFSQIGLTDSGLLLPQMAVASPTPMAILCPLTKDTSDK